MININEIYQLLEDFSNKDQASGIIAPDVLNRYAPMAQMEVIVAHMNEPEAYRYGSQAPRKGYESSKAIMDIFSDIKEPFNQSVDSNGYADQPDDYLYFSSGIAYSLVSRFGGESKTIARPIEVVRDNELAGKLSSEIEPPSKDYPIITFMSGKWRVYPFSVTNIEGTYLREPKTPHWASTTVNNVEVYDASNSQDFELPLKMKHDLLYKLCQYIGVRMREPFLNQVSSQLKRDNV